MTSKHSRTEVTRSRAARSALAWLKAACPGLARPVLTRPGTACLGATILTASCAMGPTYVEEDFGRSVRQMVDAQISDPALAADPSPRAPGGLDGVTAGGALSEYRKGARRESEAQRDITLSID